MLDVRIGAPARRDRLTLFALVTPVPVDLPYRLLADALLAGTVEISEVDGGSVPALLARNRDRMDVLILDGEQLLGARQNRMTNRSLVVGAGLDTRIPVSCMERGRWTYRAPGFTGTPWHSPSKVRRKAREVEAGVVESGGEAAPPVLRSAQGRVRSEIARQADLLDAHVPTALNEIHDAKRADLDMRAAAFPRRDGQVGLLAFDGPRPLGLDVVGSPALYAGVHDRLVRGYVMDALGNRSFQGGVARTEDAQSFLRRTRAATRGIAPTVGMGEYAVLTGTMIGGELVHGDRLVHLCAFPA